MQAWAEATLAAIPERTTAAVGRLTGVAYALGNQWSNRLSTMQSSGPSPDLL